MSSQAGDLARRLARDAEAVCRHYLSNGRREGHYWLAGDVSNTPGRSLYVRLTGPEYGRGAAGKWTDAATGEHGDLLDLIAMNRGLDRLRDVLDEARSFLALPRTASKLGSFRRATVPGGSPESARRLFAISRPVSGTLAEAYLRKRGITALHGTGALRFHPRCYYRPHAALFTETWPTGTWPALIAAVTDLTGAITGAHRTYLDPSGAGKALIETPRRAMGQLLGNGVRFGVAGDVLAAGEGIETMLSLRSAMPALPMVAALSAYHLAALLFPPGLRRLYVARDNDPAGGAAMTALTSKAQAAGIRLLALSPRLGDFNDDLQHPGLDELRAALRVQLAPEDVTRFMAIEDGTGMGR
jgi:plasmid stabilization system protein ParE/TM2 domain-containing membrane protein YozV